MAKHLNLFALAACMSLLMSAQAFAICDDHYDPDSCEKDNCVWVNARVVCEGPPYCQESKDCTGNRCTLVHYPFKCEPK